MFDVNDVPVTDPALDVCGKRLSSCKCRFGATNVLNFGSFPAAAMMKG
jgi:lambda family phage minor tail protein L